MNDLKGRTFIVTGANTGIGRVTARELAKGGARVVLACRNEAKTKPVIDEINKLTGRSDAEFLALDLGDLASVRRAAQEFRDRGLPLHGLINNAGLAGQKGTTKDGFEVTFGTNHLGHFLFTTLLLDLLKASAPSRIVSVSSRAHYQVKDIDWEKLRKPNKSLTGLKPYAVSKLANVLFTQELARRLEGSKVTTYAVHPGVIASDVWRKVPWPIRPMATAFMKSTEEGAQPSLRCATAPELATVTGRYYDADCQEKAANRAATPELAAELWKRSEAWTA